MKYIALGLGAIGSVVFVTPVIQKTCTMFIIHKEIADIMLQSHLTKTYGVYPIKSAVDVEEWSFDYTLPYVKSAYKEIIKSYTGIKYRYNDALQNRYIDLTPSKDKKTLKIRFSWIKFFTKKHFLFSKNSLNVFVCFPEYICPSFGK